MTVSTNYTIDNVNPMISYLPAGSWREGNPMADTQGHLYSDSTFTMTTIPKSYMSFSFNGTAIWVFGGKRGNHGNYSVTLDDLTSYDTGLARPDMIPATLFSATDLSNGPHQINVTHTDTASGAGLIYLDIDSITWTVETPEVTMRNTIQDTSSSFTYTPPDVWSNSGPIFSKLQAPGHETSVAGAQATLNFVADGISLFGVIGPSNGPYSVQIDGGKSYTFNATKQTQSDGQMVLFSANGLGESNHTMVITNLPDQSGQSVAIDSAVLQKLPESGGTKGGDTGAGHRVNINGRSSPLSTGAIVGITIAAVLILLVCLFALLAFLIRRRERHRQRGIDNQPKATHPHNTSITTPFRFYVGRGGDSGNGSEMISRTFSASSHSSEQHML